MVEAVGVAVAADADAVAGGVGVWIAVVAVEDGAAKGFDRLLALDASCEG